MSNLLLFNVINDFDQSWHHGPLQVFVMHVVHDAQKVNGLIANVRRLNISHPARDAVDDVVRQFFRNHAAARCENGDQSPANSFVQNARALGIGSVPTTLHPSVIPRFHRMFDIPDDVGFHFCVPLGYPQGNFGPNVRKPTSETTFLDRWGAPVPWT